LYFLCKNDNLKNRQPTVLGTYSIKLVFDTIVTILAFDKGRKLLLSVTDKQKK